MEKLKKIINSQLFYYIMIITVAILMSLPLFQSGIHTGHDGDFHISRVIGTVEQIKNGESIFVISRFSKGLGFGWNLFYPPISTLINVLFSFITGNAIISMKIFIFLTFVLSGITMFQCVNSFSKNKFAALFASILYMIAPYRLLNSYTRLAVGEMISFTFIPLIFRGIYLILNGKTEKAYLFIFGTIGLVLSHNISTLLIFILGVIYVLINIKNLKDKKILRTLIFSAIIIVLSVLFFEIPLLEQKSMTDYEVFRYGKMYSRESVEYHALNPLQLFYRNANGADSSMYFCLGLPVILSLLLIPFTLKESLKENKKTYLFFLISGLIAMIMSTIVFPWFLMPDILLMIQFPWRMHVIMTFCFAIIGGINFSIMYNMFNNKIKKEKNKTIISIICIIIFTVLCCVYSLTFVKDLEVQELDNSHYEEEEIIDTKYEVSRYSSFLEYWPQKAIKNIDYINEYGNKIHILSGLTTIIDEQKINGTLTFEIKNAEEGTILELPYLFYKGYKIEYKSNNDNKIEYLTPTESEHGLVQIRLDKNMNGTFRVSYHITTIHKICIIISTITIISYIIFLFTKLYKKRFSNASIK